MENIKNGFKYGYGTTPCRGPACYAHVNKFIRHTYGKHTAYGERTTWRLHSIIECGIYPTRPLAIAGAKSRIKEIMGTAPENWQERHDIESRIEREAAQ